MSNQRECRWGRGCVRPSPGWVLTPEAAPGTGHLWTEWTPGTHGLRCSFPACSCLNPWDTRLWELTAERGRTTAGSSPCGWDEWIPENLFKYEEIPEFKCFFIFWLTWILSCGRDLYITSSERRPLPLGLPPVRRALTALRELSPHLGSPSHSWCLFVQEWNGALRLVRKTDVVKAQGSMVDFGNRL